MEIRQLLQGLEYSWLTAPFQGEIRALCDDTRKLLPSSLFVAVKGANRDTHNDLELAYQAGAVAAVVEHPVAAPDDLAIILVPSTRRALAGLAAAWYGHPDRELNIVGITGTKGKTTVTSMLAQIMQAAGIETATMGTRGAIYDGTIHDLPNTTPAPLLLYSHMRGMVDAGVDTLIMEVSSQAVKQERTAGLHFWRSLFLNISEGDHISPTEHRDFAEYLSCKAEILQQSELAWINGDDPHLAALLPLLSVPFRLFGRSEASHVRVTACSEAVVDGWPGQRFSCTGRLSGEFFVAQPGSFSAMNALAALIVADEAGIETDVGRLVLSRVQVEGRLEIAWRDDDLTICIDDAHNGYSMRHALTALREFRPTELIAVFGCNGQRDISRRPDMGRAAGELADRTILTTGHNRGEAFADIINDIESGIKPTGGRYRIIESRDDAIREAVLGAPEGALVAVLGRGHERFLQFGDHVEALNDKECALRWLAVRQGR